MEEKADHHGCEPPIGSARVIEQRRREVLNYFGSCPNCGYSAHAFLIATYYANGRICVTTEGSCGLPCGWLGPIEVTTMTTGN